LELSTRESAARDAKDIFVGYVTKENEEFCLTRYFPHGGFIVGYWDSNVLRISVATTNYDSASFPCHREIPDFPIFRIIQNYGAVKHVVYSGRRLTIVFDRKGYIRNFAPSESFNFDAGKQKIRSYLPLAYIASNVHRINGSPYTLAGLDQSRGDVNHTGSRNECCNARHPDHQKRPVSHLLLGFQIILGALCLLVGLYILPDAFHGRTGKSTSAEVIQLGISGACVGMGLLLAAISIALMI
jgi:hypothetical protein